VRQKQLRDNPTRRDIETGDALNLALTDLSDPRLGSAILRTARMPVASKLIAKVPFVEARERVILTLQDLSQSFNWSADTEERQRFANDKKSFDNLVAKMSGEASYGIASANILREARSFMNDLRARLKAQPLKDPGDQKRALNFITVCTSLLRLLHRPDIRPVLFELEKLQVTTVCNLLGFMHAFNLRFGAATLLPSK
jgi:hypothetical protein